MKNCAKTAGGRRALHQDSPEKALAGASGARSGCRNPRSSPGKLRAGIGLRGIVMFLLAVSAPACAGSGKDLAQKEEIEERLTVRLTASPSERAAFFSEELSSPWALSTLSSDKHELAGDMFFRKGSLGEAYAEYEASLLLAPETLTVRYKRGLLFLAGGADEQALADLQRVLRREPGHALAHQGLGQLFFQRRHFEKAKTHFYKALEKDPTLWKSRNFLGVIYNQQGEHPWAAVEFRGAISLRPDLGLLYNNLGHSYSLAGSYERAITAFSQAILLQPEQRKFHNNLGMALARAGKHEEALDAFRGAGDDAQAHHNLGCVYLLQGNRGAAARLFKRAIELREPAPYPQASENLRKCKRNTAGPVSRTPEVEFDLGLPPEKY